MELGIYPAVDPLGSTSRILDPLIVGKEHYQCAQRVKEILQRYKELQDKYDVIGDVRGLGAMVGIEFVKDRETKEPATKLVADLIQNAIQKGLLLESCGTASNTVRFLAPLTMTDEQMERGLEIFEEALKEALEA